MRVPQDTLDDLICTMPLADVLAFCVVNLGDVPTDEASPIDPNADTVKP